MAGPPAKLFHAVVVLGAALTSCEQRGAETPPRPAEGAAPSAPAQEQAAPPPSASASEKCPPGSELPYPPCYYIR